MVGSFHLSYLEYAWYFFCFTRRILQHHRHLHSLDSWISPFHMDWVSGLTYVRRLSQFSQFSLHTIHRLLFLCIIVWCLFTLMVGSTLCLPTPHFSITMSFLLWYSCGEFLWPVLIFYLYIGMCT